MIPGTCIQNKETNGPFDSSTIISVFIVIFAIVIIAIALYCLCKTWTNSGSSGSNRQG